MLEISRLIESGVVVLAVSGKLNIAGAALLEQELEGWYAGGGGSLLLNLRRVSYLGSMGLRVLMRFTRDARNAGSDLILVSVNDAIFPVFDITGFSRLRKRGAAALLPAGVLSVLGQLGARELRATLWIALTTTRRVAAIAGSRF